MAEVKPRLTQKERAERRKQMAECVRSGMPTRVVAKKFGVSAFLVGFSCDEAGVVRRRDRRAQIAACVVSGATVAIAAEKFCVSVPTVRNACRAMGVVLPTTFRPPVNLALQVLSRLLAGDAVKAVSKSFGIPPHHVGQIYLAAADAGIPGLPERSK